MNNEAHMESSPVNQFSVNRGERRQQLQVQDKCKQKERIFKQLERKQAGETISHDHVLELFPRIASPSFFRSFSVAPGRFLSYIQDIHWKIAIMVRVPLVIIVS